MQQPALGKSKYSLAAYHQDLLFLNEVKPRLNPEALAATRVQYGRAKAAVLSRSTPGMLLVNRTSYKGLYLTEKRVLLNAILQIQRL